MTLPRIRQYSDLVRNFKNFNSSEKSLLLKSLTPDLIKFIVEIILNSVQLPSVINENVWRSLKRREKLVGVLVGVKTSMKRRRNIINKAGSRFLKVM